MKKYVVVLLHSGYWLTFLIVISLFSLIDTHGTKIEVLSPVFIGSIIPSCIGFYFFYGKLFDNYLAEKTRKNLLFFAALVISIANLTTLPVLYFIYKPHFFMGLAPILTVVLLLSSLSLINGLLGFVLKGFINWYKDIKIKAELNKKNYEMEIALLKAQINPHFLFNTINNIDMLIEKDSDKASNYLNKLSDIMRFMLYETKTEKIGLVKELSYIEKYIALQRIRTTNPNYVKYNVKGTPGDLLIEPMLFIPLIENAFKHAENKKLENAIKICFDIDDHRIMFECENTFSTNSQLKPEYSGLGNDLIQRRLVLLYPNKHTFQIVNKNNTYKVNLLLSLKDEI